MFYQVEANALHVVLVNLVVLHASLVSVEVSADYLNGRNRMKLYVGTL